jgi:hypothetical protein
MLEERFCPHCGRSNPKTMPRCINCGQRIVKTNSASGTESLLLEEESATLETSHTPWWQTDARSPVPPPPQVREQRAREEAKQRDLDRVAEQERLFEERLRTHEASRDRIYNEKQASFGQRNPSSGRGTGNCWRCGTAMGEGGASFSFCLHCGADLSATGKTGATGTQSRFTSAAAPEYRSTFQTTQEERYEQHNRQRTTVNANIATTRRTTSPAAAALFSFFIPGVGQFMNGQTAKGILLLLASIVFGAVVIGAPAAGLIRLGVSIIAAIDAYRVAERRRMGKEVRREEWDLG